MSSVAPVIAAPSIGTRWMLKSGNHRGQVVTVERVTSVSVYVKPDPTVAGASSGKAKARTYDVIPVTREAFYKRYELANGRDVDAPKIAYRRVAEPKAPPPIEAPKVVPAAGIVETHGARLNLEVMMVTPDLARGWLARGGTNRRLRKQHVTSLAARMRRGEWRLNGEAIKLDDDAHVRDGRHRLEAIVESGVTIQTLVVRGVTAEAFDTLDSGRTRNVADVLGLHGHTSTIATASACRALIAYDQVRLFVPQTRELREAPPSATQVLAYLKAHHEIHEGIVLADALKSAGLQGGTGLWAAILVVFLRKAREQALIFHEQLRTGADLEAHAPALMLRNRAMRQNMYWTRTSSARNELAGIAIKAWNAFRADETIVQLRLRYNEPFPEVR